jgi:hypothetical protein
MILIGKLESIFRTIAKLSTISYVRIQYTSFSVNAFYVNNVTNITKNITLDVVLFTKYSNLYNHDIAIL